MKNILVTGISRGMGKAVAKLLLNEGYFVYGVYNTNSDSAKELLKVSTNLKLFQCDFSNRENTLKLIADLNKVKFNGIVNSAGVFLPIDTDDFDFTVWDKTFEINLSAPLLLIQGLKENLEENSSIVNISSIDGMMGGISGIAYAASKAALINLTMSLANTLANKKIRTNTIAPGWIGDAMQSPQDLIDLAAENNPMKRVGNYDEIANVVSFLLSDKSSYMNGSTVTVDGGESVTSYILQQEAKLLK